MNHFAVLATLLVLKLCMSCFNLFLVVAHSLDRELCSQSERNSMASILSVLPNHQQEKLCRMLRLDRLKVGVVSTIHIAIFVSDC
jgi:hypothetical protein